MNKHKILMADYELSILNFLKEIAYRHSEIRLTSVEGNYFFGFDIGLGINFTLAGKASHKIKIKSVGMH
jgi:hypothetical protein